MLLGGKDRGVSKNTQQEKLGGKDRKNKEKMTMFFLIYLAFQITYE